MQLGRYVGQSISWRRWAGMLVSQSELVQVEAVKLFGQQVGAGWRVCWSVIRLVQVEAVMLVGQ